MFDWQTDEDQSEWIESEQPSPPTPKRRLSVRWWLVILCGVLVTGTVVYTQANQRVEEATTATKQEVLATHILLMNAADNGDVSLFWGNLSAADPEWNESLRTAIQTDTFFDRQFYGVGFAAEDTAVSPTIDDISLADDFRQAEVSYLMPYVVEVGEGMTETVQLEHTAVYRKGRDRWLYAPPRSDFWGGQKTLQFNRLQLDVPATDSELALEYGAQINQYLEQFCGEYQFDCAEDWQIEVRFSPELLNEMGDDRSNLLVDQSIVLQLPTPSLLGRPQSDEAQLAQLNSYANLIVTHAMAELVEYECCEHQNLFNLLVDKQLSELSIRPVPFSEEQNAQIFERWTQEYSRPVWDNQEMTATQRQFGYLELLFLQKELGLSNKALIEALLQTNGRDPVYALYRELGNIEDRATLELKLIRFVYDHSTHAAEDIQSELPNQSIYLSCEGTQSAQELSILKYSFQAEKWDQERTYPIDEASLITFVQPIPESNNFLINQRNLDPENEANTVISIFLWREVEIIPLLLAEENVGFYLPAFINDGQNLVVQKFFNNSINQTETIMFDLTSCTNDGCLQTIIGDSIYYKPAPNKDTYFFYGNSSEFHQSHTFFAGDIYLTDDITEPAKKIASNVYQVEWFGNRHLILLQLIEDDPFIQWQLNLYNIETETMQRLYSSADNELTRISDAQQLSDLSFSASFNDNALVYIRFLPRGLSPEDRGWVELVFDIDVETGLADVQQLPQRIGNIDTVTSLENDWLMFGDFSNYNGNSFALTLFNIETHQTYQINAIDFNLEVWSEDKKWVVYQLNEFQFALLAPDSGYQYLLPPHEGVNCYTLNWGAGS
ncbi:MAG: hypothetical protein AAF490_00125 [Chloroflexota bacterium]